MSEQQVHSNEAFDVPASDADFADSLFRRHSNNGTMEIVVRKNLGSRLVGVMFIALQVFFVVSLALANSVQWIPLVALGLIGPIHLAAAMGVIRSRLVVSPTTVTVRNFRTRTFERDDVQAFVVKEAVDAQPSGRRKPTKVEALTSAGRINVWALSFEYATGDRSALEGRALVKMLNSELDTASTF